MFLEKIFDTFIINENTSKYNNIDINGIRFNEIKRIVQDNEIDNIMDIVLDDNHYKETMFILLLNNEKGNNIIIPYININNKKYNMIKIKGNIDINEHSMIINVYEDRLFKESKIIGQIIYKINIDFNDNDIINFNIKKLLRKNKNINDYNVSLFIEDY